MTDAAVLPRRGVLALAAPLMVSFMMRQAFTLVDGFFAAYLGRHSAAGDSLVAAISLTVPFEFLMIACWVGTSNGLTARLAAAMGAGEGERIEQLRRATLRIVFALCAGFLVVAGVAYLLAGRIAPDPAVAREFRIYAPVLLAGSAFTSFWSILPDSLVKAHHDTKSTMWAGIFSNLLNVGLNALFVFVFHWGIFGIAFSTVLGRLAGLTYAVGRAHAHESRRRASGRDTRPGTYERPVRAILQIAVPGSITFMLMSAEFFSINEILKHTDDPVPAVAAWGAFDRWLRLMAMPVIAMGVAMLPLAARLFGEHDVPGIRAELRTALVTTLAYTALVVLPFALLFGAPAAHLMTSTPEARRLAELGMRFLPVGVVAMSPLFVVRSVFDGLHMPRPGLIVSLIRTIVLAVPMTWGGIRIAESLGYEPIAGAYTGFNAGVAIASGMLVLWARATLREMEGGGAR